MKANLLLTGSTGFIGRYLLETLEESYKDKYNIILLSTEKKYNHLTILHKNYSFTKEDFINENITNIDIVLHAGAFTPKSNHEANNVEKSLSNITHTLHLIKNLPNIPQKFIFLSTLDVYGNVKEVINETTSTLPLTMYGFSKLYCEKMLEKLADNYNFILQILRIGHIYGKGEEAYKKLIPVVINKLKNNENIEIVGTGYEKRSFLHVKDAVKVIIKSIDLEKYVGPINICSNRAYTVQEIIEILINISGKEVNIKHTNTDYRGIDYVFDTSKMNNILGNETIDIYEGLKDEFYG